MILEVLLLAVLGILVAVVFLPFGVALVLLGATLIEKAIKIIKEDK